MVKKTKIKQLDELLLKNPNMTNPEIAAKMGITKAYAAQLKALLKKKLATPPVKVTEEQTDQPQSEQTPQVTPSKLQPIIDLQTRYNEAIRVVDELREKNRAQCAILALDNQLDRIRDAHVEKLEEQQVKDQGIIEYLEKKCIQASKRIESLKTELEDAERAWEESDKRWEEREESLEKQNEELRSQVHALERAFELRPEGSGAEHKHNHHAT